MNSFLQDLLAETAKKGVSDKIGSSLNIPSNQANSVISMLMPALMGGLQKNAANPTEAEKIASAVQKDHAGGGIFDHLDDLISNPQASKGDGILKHILGDKQQIIEQSVAKKSGLDSAMVSKIMPMVAPLIMGYLGKKMTGNSSSTPNTASLLTGLLGGGSTSAAKEQSFLENLIDQDNDGSIMDDVLGMGMKFFKS